MTVGVLLPIHDKPLETVQAALEGLDADQVVIVLDRAPQAIVALVEAHYRARWDSLVKLDGPPGWRSPCVSFNAGLEHMTTDITIINHSDIQQMPGNIEVVCEHFAAHPNSVLFGMVLESKPEELTGPGNAGPLLMGTGNPRPLTFMTAIPTKALRDIGGWDLEYMKGVCYEDDDLTARLWKHGLDFHFNDNFSGIHHTHSRAYFVHMRTYINQTTFVNKHGRRDALGVVMSTKPTITRTSTTLCYSHTT